MSLSDILHSKAKSVLQSSMTPGRLPKRRIATFDGTNYGTIDTLIVASAGDTLEIILATTSIGLAHFVCDGDSASNRIYVYFTLSDTVVWNVAEITALTIDGVAATSGVTAAPNDGKIHTIIATLSAGAKLSTIGADYVINQDYHGQILSVKYTDNTGTAVTNFVFDSGSTTDQPSRGGSNNITLVNFTAANWNRYTLQRNITHDAGIIVEAWVGDNLVVNGGFDADTDWVKGAGWSIGSGVATHVTPNTNVSIKQTIPDLLVGVNLLSFDVPRFVSGSVVPYLGGTFGAGVSTIGNHKQVINHSLTVSTIELFSSAGADFDGDIDSVSVRKLLEVA